MTPPHAPTHFVRQPISLCTALIVQTATSGASPESTDVSECVCEYVSECVCVSECVSECVCVCECVSLSTLSFSLSLSTALCASLSLNKVVQKKTTQWHAMQRFLLNSHLTHVHWRCDIHMHLCQAVVPFQKQERGEGAGLTQDISNTDRNHLVALHRLYKGVRTSNRATKTKPPTFMPVWHRSRLIK